MTLQMLLFFGPWIGTVCLVFMAPRRSRQFMMTLAYFQVWMGYNMLSVPTPVIIIMQALVSVLYVVAEYIVEHSSDYFDTLFRPNVGPRGSLLGTRTIEERPATRK